jgi:hypothetical protein
MLRPFYVLWWDAGCGQGQIGGINLSPTLNIARKGIPIHGDAERHPLNLSELLCQTGA